MTRSGFPLRTMIAALAMLNVVHPAGAQATPQALTLEQAIALAQTQSIAAHAAANSLKSARAQTRLFHASLLPQVTLIGTAPSFSRQIDQVTQPDGSLRSIARTQTQAALSLGVQQPVPFTGGQLSFTSSLSRVDFSGTPGGTPATRFWSSSPAVVGYQQTLFQINRFTWDARAQTLSAQIAEDQYLEQQEAIAGQVVSAFFGLFAARASLDNGVVNGAINDTLYRMNQGRYQVGKIGEDDLLQSELALLRTQAETENARLSYENALNAFRLQLGLAPGTPIELVPPITFPPIPIDTTRAVAAALRNSSAAANRELRAVQAERAVREAKAWAGLTATLSAEVGYNQSGSTFADAYRAPIGQQQVSLGLTLPLIQWGAGKARIAVARTAQETDTLTARQETQQQAQDAYTAARQVEQLRQQVVLAAKADTVATKRFEVAKNRYLVGKTDGTTLFNAQNEKDAALQAYTQALGAYWAGYYRLRQLTLYDFATGREITTVNQ